MPQKYFNKTISKSLTILLICIFLVYLNPRNIFAGTRNFILTATYPLQKIFYLTSTSISGLGDFLSSIGNLKNENANLIKENNNLAAKLALLQDAEKENETFREQLRLAPRDKFDLESALVIAQDPQKLNSWIVIDKGSNDEIMIGMPVIVSDGILIGRIEEVNMYSSKVKLLSDPESIVNVVDVATGAKGILQGEYGLGITMNMVSKQDTLNNNDDIVTSDLGSNIPQGLLVGKITEVGTSSDKLFQQAVIESRVKYSKQDVVFVIKK